MGPLLQTAIKVGSKVNPKYLQALSSRQNIMKMIERGKMQGTNVKSLENAYKVISRKMHKMK